MFRKFNFSLLLAISVFFLACDRQGPIESVDHLDTQTIFEKSLNDHTQTLVVQDQGDGVYTAIGEQGTLIQINDALVNSSGERVRGTIEIELVEIYTMPDMVLLQKQTMADYDGQLNILESGGEIFVKITQNGEEVHPDNKGNMRIYLPTANTGGAKENMELFYGTPIGDQVMWKPTGESIRVVNNESRNGEYYQIMVQDILGWMNVDLLFEGQGEMVECIDVLVDCNELCGGQAPLSMTANIYLNSVNSAFEIPIAGGNNFQLCGGFPQGGSTVTFIVIIECPDGTTYVAIITTTLSAGNHVEFITCDNLVPMTPGELEIALHNLL